MFSITGSPPPQGTTTLRRPRVRQDRLRGAEARHPRADSRLVPERPQGRRGVAQSACRASGSSPPQVPPARLRAAVPVKGRNQTIDNDERDLYGLRERVPAAGSRCMSAHERTFEILSIRRLTAISTCAMCATVRFASPARSIRTPATATSAILAFRSEP